MPSHCKNGHELTEQNTYTSKSGWVRCNVCKREAQRLRRLPGYVPPPKPHRIMYINHAGEVFVGLTAGRVAVVDGCDIDLALHLWRSLSAEGYAWRTVTVAPKTYKHQFLHQLILERMLGRKLSNSELVDHINRDALDNRRANLRVATNSQNQMNRGIAINCPSGVTGVHFDKDYRRWHATITVQGRTINLGYFVEKSDAARVRKDAELKYFGEFAPK